MEQKRTCRNVSGQYASYAVSPAVLTSPSRTSMRVISAPDIKLLCSSPTMPEVTNMRSMMLWKDVTLVGGQLVKRLEVSVDLGVVVNQAAPLRRKLIQCLVYSAPKNSHQV
jgi:hypothetical protein